MSPTFSTSPQVPHSELLQSWKEIANYLRRGVRTVQRWQGMGLPVRHLGHGRKAPVVADARDLDRWLHGTQLHGFKTAQPAEHLISRGLLGESIQQAHQLREEMSVLRGSHRASRERLLATLEESVKNSGLKKS